MEFQIGDTVELSVDTFMHKKGETGVVIENRDKILLVLFEGEQYPVGCKHKWFIKL